MTASATPPGSAPNGTTDPRFFGYGSLVHLATHDYPDPVPATLTGWRRVWRGTSLRELAFLSVTPCPGAAIRGVTARVPGADWAALDRREGAYARRDVSHQITPTAPDVAVYEVRTDLLTDPRGHPLLLSYIDTVALGFLEIYGPDGVKDFFATTDGWGAPIRDDRAAPMYPRWQPMTEAARALVDAELDRLGVVRLSV